MNKLKLKKIIGILVEAESGAAKQAKSQGLTYGQFGRWLDPKTGKVVAKSHGDQLIKVTPGKDDEPKDKKPIDPARGTRQPGRFPVDKAPEKVVHPADVPAKPTQQPDQQPIQPDQPSGIQQLAKKDPEWDNNFKFDLENNYGVSPDKISPKVLDILYKNQLSSEDAASTYAKVKDDVKKFKKKECRRLSSENVIREQPGEHDNKSIEQLEREIGEIEIKKQYNRGLGNFSDWSGRKFALRKKQGGSTGIRPDPKERTLAPGFKLSQFGETP